MILACGCGKKWFLKDEIAKPGHQVPCRSCRAPIVIPAPSPNGSSKEWEERIRTLEEAVASHQARLRERVLELEGMKGRVQDLESQLSRAVEERARLLAEFEERSRAKGEVETRREEAIRAAKERILHLERDLLEKEVGRKSMEARLTGLDAAVDELRRENAALREERAAPAASSVAPEWNETLGALAAELAAFRGEFHEFLAMKSPKNEVSASVPEPIVETTPVPLIQSSESGLVEAPEPASVPDWEATVERRGETEVMEELNLEIEPDAPDPIPDVDSRGDETDLETRKRGFFSRLFKK